MSRESFLCGALKQPKGPDTPADCGWPYCGCDPYASAVLDAIAPPDDPPPLTAEEEERIERSWQYIRANLSAPVRGVGRVADDARSLLVCFGDVPTDDDIRTVHDALGALFKERR